MAEQTPEIQVIIPYKQLENLLEASVELKKLRGEVRRLHDQQAALRLQFMEMREYLRRN